MLSALLCPLFEFSTGADRGARVAVGTRISSRAPRTEPYVRLSRIRLPPRVCDGKASARPRMEDDRFREPGVHQLRHLCPRDPIPLASTPQRVPPKVSDVMPEHRQCAAVSRYCMVVEVAADNPSQPLPLLGDRLVHASPHLLFDYLELRPHAVAPSLPFDLELSWRVLPQMKVKPRKLKVSGLPSPRRLRRSAAKRPNSMSRVFSG